MGEVYSIVVVASRSYFDNTSFYSVVNSVATSFVGILLDKSYHWRGRELNFLCQVLMPPNKDEQPRRGNGLRRPAEPRTSNNQHESNAASQPTVPQPIPAQTSTRQRSSGVNHNNAQRPSQPPALGIGLHSYSDVVQNKPSLPQPFGDASSTLPQSAARQSSSVADQNKAQRPRQQPAPNLVPPLYSAVAKNNMNPPQRFREDLPIQAQSSTRHDSNVGNQNNAPRLAQTTNSKSIPASLSNVAGNNMNPPQRFDRPSRHPSAIAAGDLSRATGPSLPAGNQANPEKRLFRPYQGPASRETDNSKEAPKIYGYWFRLEVFPLSR